MTTPSAPPARPKKQRVDQLLVTRGLVETRARAGVSSWKAGEKLPEDTPLRVRQAQRYVSRGGLKLEGALLDLRVDPGGLSVCDVGASTGGFTDCLLSRGARHVYAVDVGQAQLADKLRRDGRVSVMERTNARSLEPSHVGGGVELVVVDASFISLTKLLPAIARILLPGGRLLALIKPQFEVGREVATRHAGVIRDPHLRQEAIDKILVEIAEAGFDLLADAPCRVKGPKGNLEHFSLSQKPG